MIHFHVITKVFGVVIMRITTDNWETLEDVHARSRLHGGIKGLKTQRKGTRQERKRKREKSPQGSL